MKKENEKFYIDMFTTEQYGWMDKYNIHVKTGPHGKYMSALVTLNEKKQLIRLLSKKHIKCRCYEERWERASDYRKNFFKEYNPPYRCRYCNRKLKKEYMVIDHIVPIAQVKKSTNARMLLYLQGISEVNDVRNLAPSCKKCNTKKDMKLGIWFIRGILGRYKIFWVLKPIIYIMFFLLILYLVYSNRYFGLIF